MFIQILKEHSHCVRITHTCLYYYLSPTCIATTQEALYRIRLNPEADHALLLNLMHSTCSSTGIVGQPSDQVIGVEADVRRYLQK